ncbi:uncharacterized protein LOC124702840 [Lolium rigidum]|uniref:uncharacterized protein LOC124698790 n=1 Tax=Lolium rigidum TaxID=89674 RepID=UPI001F5CDF9F|nr:uncharacterized protein LOC124698790 [Lolium rigidum]XP_047090973.1 uncharacterized protein LOC124702840 [Lolium rigidum]
MAMAVIHLVRPALTPSPLLGPRGRRASRLRVRCRVGGDEGDGGRGGEDDAPESLFAKELRRRGMSAGSVPSGEMAGAAAEAEAEEGGPGGEEGRKRVVGAAAAEFERAAAGADGQRERSMALNSEGIEGLVPRAKLLLSLGGTFFLAFGPLIIVTVSLFAGLYLCFGQSFIHDGSKKPVTPPPYIDPYELLEDDRISRPSMDVF